MYLCVECISSDELKIRRRHSTVEDFPKMRSRVVQQELAKLSDLHTFLKIKLPAKSIDSENTDTTCQLGTSEYVKTSEKNAFYGREISQKVILDKIIMLSLS